MKKRLLSQAVSVIIIIAMIIMTVPNVVFGLDDLGGKTVILYSANIRGDVDVYSYMSALKNSYTEKNAGVIMVDLGNYLQGTVYSTYDSGKSVIELMDSAGYDVAAIGSYEFAFGTGKVGVSEHEVFYEDDTLGKLLEDASFEAVSANILAGEEAIAAFATNTEITVNSGLTVGFFGITDPKTSARVIESSLSGLIFADTTETIDSQIEALANCDIIICLSNVTTGEELTDAIIIEADANAGFIVGEIIIDNETGEVISNTAIDYKSAGQDEEIQTIIDDIKTTVDEVYPSDYIIKSEVTLGGSTKSSRSQETNLGDFWTDALLWFAVEGGIENYYDEDEIATDNTGIQVDKDNIVAVWNGGNLRDYINTGDITMKDIQRILPYPNKVAVMYLTGLQLVELLEAASQGLPHTSETNSACASFLHVSGLQYSIKINEAYDKGEAYGNNWFKANSINRVDILNVNGKEFDETAVYAVITSNAVVNGMDSNYVSLDKDPDISTITSMAVTDAVWLYATEKLGGVIGEEYAETQGRIIIDRSYSDVLPSAWYYDAVKYVTENNLMTGDGNLFNPNEPNEEMTRQELAAYIYEQYGSPEVSGTLEYIDADEIDEENIDAVLFCYEKGLMIGVSEDTFAPNMAVSRAMYAVVLYRMR